MKSAPEKNVLVIDGVNMTALVRFVLDGDRYGLNDCLTHEGEPMVEFYDFEYSELNGGRFGPRGQFVSRYYVDTLRRDRSRRGLCLDGGIQKWNLYPAEMDRVYAFIDQFMARRASEVA